MTQRSKQHMRWGSVVAVALGVAIAVPPSSGQRTERPTLLSQTDAAAAAKSAGCLSCHEGIEPMHASPAVNLGCTDCHGGNSSARAIANMSNDDYAAVKRQAHVAPRDPERWARMGGIDGANPKRSYTLLNYESPEFIRFINPGDLRVAQESCGGCHQEQVNNVPKSTMTTSSVFWAAVSYANGILGNKYAVLGESYSRDGKAQKIEPISPRTEEEIRKGALPVLYPAPRWETTQPGEYFRAFERGGLLQPSMFPEIGNPSPAEDAGRPDIRFSNRGPGTGLRISPGVLNLHKTRLNDPHLSFLGTNDHPGDYRSSGCSGCHVIYANDRDRFNSGPYAQFGNTGKSFSGDRAISPLRSGRPIQHRLTSAIPSSQCMSCHMHQPNSFVNTYLGYTMWDYESDAEFMFPKKQKYPTEAEKRASLDHNPEGAAVRGLWTDEKFLEELSAINPKLGHTQFADYHGHGWVFQAVYKRDRKGNLLDHNDQIVSFDDPEKFKKAVHLKDIHLERGMQCVDCHFSRDNHGDGLLKGEYAATIEIECQDCHGTASQYTNLKTTGPAAPEGGTDLRLGRTPFGQRRFAWRDGKLYQRSMVTPDLEWKVTQVKDTITPGDTDYNEKAHYAKTVRTDMLWGTLPTEASKLAHSNDKMTCYSCHSSWITSCFGCHLPQEANAKSEVQHYEGGATRNYASYNPQVIRTDVHMLGVSASIKDHKIAPVRSSSAVTLSSTNANRQRVYIQQSTISAPGYNGQAFNPHVPHTVRSRETKACSDCHISEANDNNAWMAQLLTQGTNFVNLIGRFAWVATGHHGFEAIAVTEWDEPQAVIGSSLHKIVYPDDYAAHAKRKKELTTAHHHHGEVRSLQLRGEYLFTAGEKGFEVYDVANIDNKDFSERIVTAPVSPVGQRTYIRTKHATAVALPTTAPMDPTRRPAPENQEQPIHPIYSYAFISDRDEGLIIVNVNTLTDRNPENNFFERALTFNPGGALNGAETVTVAGNYVYVGLADSVAVIDCSNPLQPQIISRFAVDHPNSIAIQFRYAFVTGAKGLTVVDITNPVTPRVAAELPLRHARSVYVARTYAYIAGGPDGVVIVDVERPEKPFVDQTFNAGGALNDTRDVKVGATNASVYAYVADGKNGLAVLQLTSPQWTPTYAGFSPRPEPRLIAKKHVHGEALAVSKGLDRDRAADESGNQVLVFNRIGARPLNLEEMQRLYLRGGKVYRVTDRPATKPLTTK